MLLRLHCHLVIFICLDSRPDGQTKVCGFVNSLLRCSTKNANFRNAVWKQNEKGGNVDRELLYRLLHDSCAEASICRSCHTLPRSLAPGFQSYLPSLVIDHLTSIYHHRGLRMESLHSLLNVESS